jgi:tetratricopeptide (TPR) repeat protein
LQSNPRNALLNVAALALSLGSASAAFYPADFHTTLSNAGVSVDKGRVADALDAYRCALQWVPYNVVTAAPVPCAQTLQALGQCFMKLGRLADAEAAYAAARRPFYRENLPDAGGA